MVPQGGGKKPKKPYPEFPLTPAGNGQWCRKIRGKLFYFGVWNDPDAALAKYKAQIDDLRAGRTPAPDASAATLRDLCNRFLTTKTAQVQARELSPLTFRSYKRACDKVIAVLGANTPVASVRPHDFERLRAKLAETNGLRAMVVYVQRVRSLFKYALDAGLIETPVRFGPGFKPPSAASIRKLRASQPPRMFEAAQIRTMLAAASPVLKAMILLGVNCGFGNSDCGWLPQSALDLDAGWVTFPRPKNGMPRRCKLWPETVKAVRAALAVRPTPIDPRATPLVFVTKFGGVYNGGRVDSAVGDAFRELLVRLGMKRKGLSYYTCRHVFATVASGCRDQVAVDYCMGHLTAGVGTQYREKIEDSRLESVAAHVRRWLYGKGKS
jgi:integrase